MAGRGRPKSEPKEEVTKFTQVVKHDDGAVTTWFWDKSVRSFQEGPVKTETKYPRGYLDFEQEQELLPMTKRKYLLDNGKIVGYARAKAIGFI